MWHSGSKCQRIGALVKASRKRLKTSLAPGVMKLGPVFIASKLGEFLLFDGFFDFSLFDLDNFQDLANFFDFSYFLACSTSSPPNLSTLLSPSFFLDTGLLPSFLLKTSLLPSFLLEASLLLLFLLEAVLLPLFLLKAGLLLSFLLETSLLPSFLLETGLLPLFLLEADSLDNPVVINIEVSGAAILLKP